MPVSDSSRPSAVETTAETTAESTAPLTSPTDAPSDDGPRKTPFPSPAPSVTIPEPTPLTREQQTNYNSLLNAVSEWCVLTTTASGASKTVSMVEEEFMWLTRECLLRYLRASKWSVNVATQRLVDTLQWRRSYGLTQVGDEPPKIHADYISPENETGKQWILGYDNEGRPCHYLNPSRQNTKRSERQIEHLVFMLERVIDIMPPGQESLALLMNFAETRTGQGASIGQGKQVLNILQSHYPERLGKALLCNLPWHIWGFMKVITPFIDPVTRSKLVFDSPLPNFVPPRHLAKSHGGTLDFTYDHATYWPALLALAAERRAALVARWHRGGKMVGEYETYLKGGTERSLQDDRKDTPNERGRGQPLNGLSPTRDGSKRSTRNRDRSVVVVLHGDVEHPLKRAQTTDSVQEEPAADAVAATKTEGGEEVVGEETEAEVGTAKGEAEATAAENGTAEPENDTAAAAVGTELTDAPAPGKTANGHAPAPTATITTVAE